MLCAFSCTLVFFAFGQTGNSSKTWYLTLFLQYLFYMIDIEKQKNLLFLLRKGEDEAFSEIYDIYWDKLYYLAYKKLNSLEIAEEIVQEVFLTLWKKRHELTINNLSQYLAAMVRYAVYRYLARESQSLNREIIFQNRQGMHFTIDESIENKLIMERILALSNELPEQCKLVFQYNKIEDQSLHDVAERLGISKKTAESHLTKALKTIRLGMRGFVNFYLLLSLMF
jgi:RNA polymerase sigma-70 factor (ECF subfamily)